MYPSSSNSISREITADNQTDQPVTYMDVALYKAAREGRIKKFDKCGDADLKSLKTPKGNTVLHVYLATDKSRDNWRLLLALQAITRNKAASFVVGQILDKLPQLPPEVKGFLQKTSKGRSHCFVEHILEKCSSLLLQDNDKGEIPLHVAAGYGHSAVVEVLVKHAKAPYRDLEQQGLEAARRFLRTKDKELNTALHTAVSYGHLEVVRALLHLEDPQFSYSGNSNQETPLYIAARRGRSRLVAEILRKFKSPAHSGPHGRTALHAAAMAGNREATRMIIEKNKSLTKEPDQNGHTPLHYAAHLGHHSVVRELLKKDRTAAYIADKEKGMTPLLMAARQGHEWIVREIISFCPDCCEIVDKRGRNFLHFLSIRCSPCALDLFLHSQIGTVYESVRNLRDEKDTNGNTPQDVYIACCGIFDILAPLEAYFYTEKLTSRFSHNSRIYQGLRKNLGAKKEQINDLLNDVASGEVAEVPVRPIDKFGKNRSDIEKAREAHLVVAALIATVSFAAAITVPGGFISEKNSSDKGTAMLIHNAAFKAFVITDALAFVFSLVAVTLHFLMALPYFHSEGSYSSLQFATSSAVCAVVAMVVAFSTGTYAVLGPSSGLAIATCCIGLSFFAILSSHFTGVFDELGRWASLLT